MVVLMSRNNKSTRYPAFFQFLSNTTFSYNSYQSGSGGITVKSTGDITTDGESSDGIHTTSAGDGDTTIDSSGTIDTIGTGAIGIQSDHYGGVGDINITQHGSGAIDTFGAEALRSRIAALSV